MHHFPELPSANVGNFLREIQRESAVFYTKRNTRRKRAILYKEKFYQELNTKRKRDVLYKENFYQELNTKRKRGILIRIKYKEKTRCFIQRERAVFYAERKRGILCKEKARCFIQREI